MEESKEKKDVNYIVVAAVILQIVFIVLAIVAIKNIFEPKTNTPKIEIANYSEIPQTSVIGQDDKKNNLDINTDDTKKSVIGGILNDIVDMNTEGYNVQNHGAKIREGSVYNVYIGALNMHLLNFIVDLEEIGQSYGIAYRWTDSYPNKSVPANEPAVAFCLDKEKLIYGDFDCRDKYDGNGADVIAYGLLKYYAFDGFSLKLSDSYDGKPLDIEIGITTGNGEPDASAEDAAVQKLSEYLASLGFDLEDFSYKIVRLRPFEINW